MQIRPEEPRDFDAIDEVVRAAFSSPEGDGTREANLVRNLRTIYEYVPELALVAVNDEEVVGHIMLTYVDAGGRRVLQLSPLAVRPDKQNAGIGDALTREALDRADARDEPLVVVLGIPTYYPRFGFESARALGLDPPDPDIPDGPWMAKRLSRYDETLTGTVIFTWPFAEAEAPP